MNPQQIAGALQVLAGLLEEARTQSDVRAMAGICIQLGMGYNSLRNYDKARSYLLQARDYAVVVGAVDTINEITNLIEEVKTAQQTAPPPEPDEEARRKVLAVLPTRMAKPNGGAGTIMFTEGEIEAEIESESVEAVSVGGRGTIVFPPDEIPAEIESEKIAPVVVSEKADATVAAMPEVPADTFAERLPARPVVNVDDEAILAAKRAIEIALDDTQRAVLLDNLGILYLARGQYDRAIERFEEARQLSLSVTPATDITKRFAALMEKRIATAQRKRDGFAAT